MGKDTRNTYFDIIILSVGIFWVASLYLCTSATAKVGTYHNTTFKWIDGLPENSEACLGGIKIVEVAGVSLGNDYSAKISFLAKSDAKIPTDTLIANRTRDMFASKHVTPASGTEVLSVDLMFS